MQTSHKDGFQQSTTASEQEVLTTRIKELEKLLAQERYAKGFAEARIAQLESGSRLQSLLTFNSIKDARIEGLEKAVQARSFDLEVSRTVHAEDNQKHRVQVAAKDARIKELEDEIARWRNTHATQSENSLTYCSWLNEVADALGVTCGNMHAIRQGLAAQRAHINALEAKIGSVPTTGAVLLQNLYVVTVPLTQNLQNPVNERGTQ